MYTESGFDYSPKSLSLVFDNHDLEALTTAGSCSPSEAPQSTYQTTKPVELAKNALSNYSWTVNGTTVSNFNVLPQASTVVFHPNTKNGLTLYLSALSRFIWTMFPGQR
jgi:hypothetical protein